MLPQRYWRVMDYIDHRNKNVILEDLNSFPLAAKLAINALIQHIEVTPPPFDVRDVKKLQNKRGQNCLGFIEFRITTQGVQYRPIAWYGPERQQITIFAVATEKNSRLVPPGICETCAHRLTKLKRHEGRIELHNLS